MCSLIAPEWQFSAENSIKLDKIHALLQSRNQGGYNSWKKLFESNENAEVDETNAEKMIIVGELDADDHIMLSQSQRVFSASQGSQSSQISTQVVGCIGPLREALSCLDDAYKDDIVELPLDCLEIFVHSTPSQLLRLCSELDLENLSYKALSTLIDGIVKYEKNLSLSWSTSFLQANILNRIFSLKQVPPRFFLISISNFAMHFPRAIIDGFMVPCVCHSNFCDIHGDILVHLFNQNLSTQHQILFVKKALCECTSWNESTVSLMNHIVENKFEFNGELLDILTSQLLQCTHSLDSSLKFGKFIQKLIATCGHDFTKVNYDALTEVLNRNKTFLKKTCLNALKKHQRFD